MQYLGSHPVASGLFFNLCFFDALMNKTYDIKKLGGDKIALLGLFALSLLTARIVVGIKSAVVLSEPIPLTGYGISVAIPAGNGWQGRKQWVLQGNTFILISQFSAGPGKPTAEVICRYYPAAGANTLTTIFQQKALEFNGEIVSSGRIETDSLTFNWARIDSEESTVTTFIGRTVISQDWQLVIEVREITGYIDQAEKVFMQIVENVNYKRPRPRTAFGGNYKQDEELSCV